MVNSGNDNIDVSIVIPVFNESEGLQELYNQVKAAVKNVNKQCEIVFVDDGSKDDSFAVIAQLKRKDPTFIKAVQFSRNFGHQLAITAGLQHASGRAIVIMDADLQDPPALIVEFIRKWDEGYEIVYGVREEREGETYFKKKTASIFYKLMKSIASIEIPENVGDFYLLDRKVVDILNSFRERHRFLRGLVAWVGYKKTGIPYIRKSRFQGQTKYPFWKMFKFSIDAITSFSFAPLRLVFWIGVMFSIISFLLIMIIIYMRLFTSTTIIGWSSIMATVLFIGGIQLLAIGVIGEYIARIGDDVKARPLYTIQQILE